jgi:hypothetical protein
MMCGTHPAPLNFPGGRAAHGCLHSGCLSASCLGWGPKFELDLSFQNFWMLGWGRETTRSVGILPCSALCTGSSSAARVQGSHIPSSFSDSAQRAAVPRVCRLDLKLLRPCLLQPLAVLPPIYPLQTLPSFSLEPPLGVPPTDGGEGCWGEVRLLQAHPTHCFSSRKMMRN